MTVGELKEHLKLFPDDWDIIFGAGDLDFFRLKMRGEKLVQFEFNQNVYKDKSGNWHVDDVGQ